MVIACVHAGMAPTEKHACARSRVSPVCRFDWKGNTPGKTNWIKGGKMTITRIYADMNTWKFDL